MSNKILFGITFQQLHADSVAELNSHQAMTICQSISDFLKKDFQLDKDVRNELVALAHPKLVQQLNKVMTGEFFSALRRAYDEEWRFDIAAAQGVAMGAVASHVHGLMEILEEESQRARLADAIDAIIDMVGGSSENRGGVAKIAVGDIVRYTSGRSLHCGSQVYPHAIVVSTQPMVLVSEGADMRWESTVEPDRLVVVGKASKALLESCMRRQLN